jgi:hypothetical protein
MRTPLPVLSARPRIPLSTRSTRNIITNAQRERKKKNRKVPKLIYTLEKTNANTLPFLPFRRHKNELSPEKISQHLKDGRKHIGRIGRSLHSRQVRKYIYQCFAFHSPQPSIPNNKKKPN